MSSSRFNTRWRQHQNAGGRAAHRRLLRQLPLASAISAILAGGAPMVVHAQAAPATQASSPDTLEEVTVTAQKVTENLQNVPVSIEAIGTQKIEQLNIANLDDYVEYLSTCAASTAARMATIPVRNPPSARISTSSR
jgi:iron complex outermembrane recepter protein